MIHFASAYITTERDGYTSVCIELVLHAARRVYRGGTIGGARLACDSHRERSMPPLKSTQRALFRSA